MSSPTAEHPPAAATAPSPIVGGGHSPIQKRDVTCVGIDGIKMFEELRKIDPTCINTNELAGISPSLEPAINQFVHDTLDNCSTPKCRTKRIVVVFDGIFLPMSIVEAKISEDLVMAASWILMKLHQEVIFAPYLASSQIEILKQSQHIQSVLKQYPPRIPGDLLEWNSSPEGPSQPNIYKYVPNLMVQVQPQHPQQFQPPATTTILSMLETPGPNTQTAQQKFIDRFSSIDEVGQNPVLFLMQFTGIISPKLARAIAYRVVESDGIKSGDAAVQSLYSFMSVLLPLRAQIVHQLIADVATVPQQIHLKWDETAGNVTPPLIQLDNWDIGPAIKGGNGPNGARHHKYIEPWAVTDVLRFESLAVSTKVEVDIFSVAPTVILRSLDLMGYFTHAQEEQDVSSPQSESSSCSIYGEALKQFASVPRLGEAAVLFIELVRTNAFQIFASTTAASASSSSADNNNAASMETEAVSDNKMEEESSNKTNNSNDNNNNNNEDNATATSAPTTGAGEGGDNNASASGAGGDNDNNTAATTGGGSSNNNIKMCEDVGIKMASIVPIDTVLPADKCERYDIMPHSQFIRGAQAHTRSLRMLVEASAGNVVLREFTSPAGRSSFSLQNMSDVLATLPAALPFVNSPSSRAFYLFCAVREFKTAAAIAEHFGVNAATVEKDVECLRQFVTLASKACACLAVRDEDVGLDPATIERVEPALSYIRASLGIATE